MSDMDLLILAWLTLFGTLFVVSIALLVHGLVIDRRDRPPEPTLEQWDHWLGGHQ